MLDGDNDAARLQLEETVNQLSASLIAPEWIGHDSQSGAISSSYTNEDRRHSRMQLLALAGLEHRQTSPSLPRQEGWHKVCIKDFSFGGLAFYHGEQLYPLERMRMVLPDERLVKVLPNRMSCTVEVVRCRRLDEHCYVVGVRFIEGLDDSEQPVEETASMA